MMGVAAFTLFAPMREALVGQCGGAPEITNPQQITIVVEGQIERIVSVERTIDQIFEVKTHQSSQNADSLTHRVSFTIDPHDKSFGKELQERLEKLIRDWNEQSKQAQVQGEFAEANDPQTLDYLYGVASGYQLAMDDLRALIVSMEEE